MFFLRILLASNLSPIVQSNPLNNISDLHFRHSSELPSQINLSYCADYDNPGIVNAGWRPNCGCVRVVKRAVQTLECSEKQILIGDYPHEI